MREGTLTIRAEGETISVEASETVHLPMRARAVVQSDADVEMVSVTYPAVLASASGIGVNAAGSEGVLRMPR